MVGSKLRIVQTLKSLSDTSRLRALFALKDHELCACQLVELLEVTPSTVSKHMALLVNAGLVDSRKEGKWVYYQLNHENYPGLIKELLSQLECEDQLRVDQGDLKSILEIDPEELCKQQRKPG